MKIDKILFFAISMFFLLISSSLFAEGYIKLNQDEINIRFSPNSNSTVVAKGMKGDLFTLEETVGDWYGISMFSGEYRYIQKSLAVKVTALPPLTSSTETKKQIFKELYKVEGKAISEASNKYPNDIDKEIDLQRILDDRYKLVVFRKYSVPPPYYYKIIAEGANKGWQ